MSMAFCTRCGAAVDAEPEGKCPVCSSLLDQAPIGPHHGRRGSPSRQSVSLGEIDLDELCVTCERKVRQQRVTRLEEFCFRCWDRVAPLVLEETEALL